MDKKKYLHIMFNEKFIKSYIEFINENLNEDEHKFIIIDGIDSRKLPYPNYTNIKSIVCKGKTIKNTKIRYFVLLLQFPFLLVYLFCNCLNKKQIYFHGFFDPRNIIFLFIFRFLLKKSNWIVWGGDLYCYENRDYKSIVKRVWYKIEDYVKRNIGYVNTLVPGDYDIAKKYYNVKGKYKEMRYPCELIEINLDRFKNINKREIYIQIGNSGDPSNNHLEILECLKKYKDYNIKIFAILSYGGDKEYINKVKKYGEKLFGSKFISIIDFMPYKKYWEYLSNIDILIFNHKRQQGLGNIVMLSYFEKKIYLRSDISSWDYLTGNIGLRLNDYAQITKQNFEEFKDNNACGNREKCLKTFYSKEYIKNILEKNFRNELWWENE